VETDCSAQSAPINTDLFQDIAVDFGDTDLEVDLVWGGDGKPVDDLPALDGSGDCGGEHLGLT
jgi:hypothetical protein